MSHRVKMAVEDRLRSEEHVGVSEREARGAIHEI